MSSGNKKGSRKLTQRQPTERSQSVVSHVDQISTYNARLSSLLENEKAKDETMRMLEKQLFADKLKHAELIAEVSMGHELVDIEEKFNEDYVSLEEAHEATATKLRETLATYEEVAARLSLADVEGVMLQQQVQQARVREETLAQQHETMLSKLETLKQNEKASHTKAQAATKHRLEVESQHDKAFEERPSTQAKRKGEGEVKALVGEVQRLRSEHDKLMKKLHAKEAQEIRAFEEEAAGKIQEQEKRLKAQFSKEELKAIAKHDTYQRELKGEMDRLEAKMKAKMESEEASMRGKIKTLSMQQTKASTSVESLRQQVVDFLAERNVHATQAKHLDTQLTERSSAAEKLRREEAGLKADVGGALAITKASIDKAAKVKSKYALVVKQNKKMADEIGKYSGLVNRGETELEFAAPNKRLRLHQDKLGS